MFRTHETDKILIQIIFIVFSPKINFIKANEYNKI